MCADNNFYTDYYLHTHTHILTILAHTWTILWYPL